MFFEILGICRFAEKGFPRESLSLDLPFFRTISSIYPYCKPYGSWPPPPFGRWLVWVGGRVGLTTELEDMGQEP